MESCQKFSPILLSPKVSHPDRLDSTLPYIRNAIYLEQLYASHDPAHQFHFATAVLNE